MQRRTNAGRSSWHCLWPWQWKKLALSELIWYPFVWKTLAWLWPSTNVRYIRRELSIATCIHIYIHLHTCTHACIPTYLPTYVHTCIHTYLPTYVRTYVRTCMHTYIHTDRHTHTYIYKYKYSLLKPIQVNGQKMNTTGWFLCTRGFKGFTLRQSHLAIEKHLKSSIFSRKIMIKRSKIAHFSREDRFPSRYYWFWGRFRAFWMVPCPRKGKTIFQDVNLSVSQGKLVALTGPAGSGKSKLLKMLVGDASPSSGQATQPRKCHNGAIVYNYIKHQKCFRRCYFIVWLCND